MDSKFPYYVALLLIVISGAGVAVFLTSDDASGTSKKEVSVKESKQLDQHIPRDREKSSVNLEKESVDYKQPPVVIKDSNRVQEAKASSGDEYSSEDKGQSNSAELLEKDQKDQKESKPDVHDLFDEFDEGVGESQQERGEVEKPRFPEKVEDLPSDFEFPKLELKSLPIKNKVLYRSN